MYDKNHPRYKKIKKSLKKKYIIYCKETRQGDKFAFVDYQPFNCWFCIKDVNYPELVEKKFEKELEYIILEPKIIHYF